MIDFEKKGDQEVKPHLIVAGISNDFFTEKYLNYLKSHNVKITSFTGFDNWQSPNVESTIYATDAMFAKRVHLSFPDVEPAVLDHEILSAIEPIRNYFLRILDRFFIQPVSFRQAEDYFNELAAYVVAYLREGGPFTAFFSLYSPHSPVGLMTYQVCRCLNIPYYFGVRTLLPDMMMFSSKFEEQEVDFFHFQDADFHYCLKSATSADLDRLVDQESWMLTAGKSINKTGSIYLANKVSSGNFLSRLARKKYMVPLIPYLKPVYDIIRMVLTGHFLRNEYYGLSRTKALVLFWRNRALTRRLSKWMARHAEEAVTERDYVYFSLHYQPERTTDPDGGYFTQQYLAIKALASVLPKGMHIYVKEHPRQYVDFIDIAKINFRDIKEYQQIAALENVSFVPIETDSSVLIKNAKLVAAVSGSAIWEGLQQKVPGLSFGFTWHSDCESGPLCRTSSQLQEVVPKLLAKTGDEVRQDVQEFLLRNKAAFVPTAVGETMANESKFCFDKLAENFGMAILELLQFEEQKIASKSPQHKVELKR